MWEQQGVPADVLVARLSPVRSFYISVVRCGEDAVVTISRTV